ncbi:MAG: glycerophosphodiester phosphodiesterase [Pseudobutyrivibrio sp.]|nr:glycerophosphodiester phosphodiesterase [Pseudobutyrivibrio sp.]
MKRPVVWAHRGASGYLPENTLEAFQKAVDMGADGIELDIHKTKDGQLVVIHDEKIDRTSDGTGYVKDYTLEELRRYNYNATMPDSCSHANIPTMREVFELIKPTKLSINIEIKTGIVFYEGIEEDIVALTKEYDMEDRVIYSSFNHYSIMKIKEIDPEAKTGFLYMDGTLDMPEYGQKHGVNALHPALYNVQYPNYVEDCHNRGLAINTWTVNSKKYMKMACDMGLDGIITNYPDVALEIVDDYKWD